MAANKRKKNASDCTEDRAHLVDFSQSRNKKRKKGSADAGALAAAGHRNWSELPDLPLRSVLDRLFSFPDVLAFSGVCHSWRSLSKSATGKVALASYPPMILRPVRLRLRRRGGLNPLRFRLDTLADPCMSYRCMMPSATVSGFCIGYSFGNLVVLVGRRPLISDVFRGVEILAPELPDDGQKYDHGFLTAPPSSPDCRLLLSGSDLLFWRVGTAEWSSFLLRVEFPGQPRIAPLIQQVLVFKGRIYALDYGGRVVTIHFSPHLSVEPLEGIPQLLYFNFVQQLVQCGEELLALCFTNKWPEVLHVKINVFRLDFSRKAWVEVENLGDWSLFVDATGRSPVSCISPARWGGRSNCIYILGPEHDSWTVFPLDGTLIDLSWKSPLCPVKWVPQSWSSPIWVYPSELY